MFFRLRQFLGTVKASLWFLPTALGLCGLALAIGSLEVDRLDLLPDLRSWLALEDLGASGVRAVLGVIAGGMMTVTSLVFSLTFVALSTLSGQLGPRILLYFLQDRATKVVMGLFIGTFAFALLALASTRAADDVPPPVLTFVVAIALALISLGAVIYFVDHIAHTMQADKIVAGLGAKLDAAILRSLREEADESDPSEEEIAGFRKGVRDAPTLVHAPHAGYVSSIDHAGLVLQAAECEGRVDLLCTVNGFVFENEIVARIDAKTEEGVERLSGAVLDGIAIAERRMPSQHANFEIAALTEVALRALSPGINDPYTASAAIYQLGNALARIVAAVPLRRLLSDDGGEPRLLRPVESLGTYLDESYSPILAATEGSPIALEALVDALLHMRVRANRETDREAVSSYLAAADEAIERDVSNPRVREALRNRIEAATGEAVG